MEVIGNMAEYFHGEMYLVTQLAYYFLSLNIFMRKMTTHGVVEWPQKKEEKEQEHKHVFTSEMKNLNYSLKQPLFP